MHLRLMVAILVFGMAATSAAAVTPSDQARCFAAKTEATGSYFRCAQNAVARGTLGRRGHVERCQRRLAVLFDRATQRFGASCSAVGDPTLLQSELDAAVTRISQLLGTTPPPDSGCATGGHQTIVTLSLDAPISSARVDLVYPPAVSLPGRANEASVRARVAFLLGGFTIANDIDSDENGTDETLIVAQVTSEDHDPGEFAKITFDGCDDSEPVPATAFSCTVSSAALNGDGVTGVCTIAVR